jgi:hypothetical protein
MSTQRFTKRFPLSLCCVLGLGLGLSALGQTNYYVSRKSGSDTNSGTSAAAPWKTLTKVSSVTFQPGDKILLKRGDVWNEPLYMHGSGKPEAIIELSAYGEGARPMIRRNNVKEDRCLWWADASFTKTRSIAVSDAGMGIIIAGVSNSVEDCIAYNIKGLYGTPQEDGKRWSVGIGGNRVTDCEVWGGGGTGLGLGKNHYCERVFVHDQNCTKTSYCGADIHGGGVLRNSVFDASVYWAPLGTSLLMYKWATNAVIDSCIFKNTPDSKAHDQCAIDFEDNNDGIVVTNCVFENNAGAAFEFLAIGVYNRTSQNVEIKNSTFIKNNWAHKFTPAEIEFPSGTSGTVVRDNVYELADGVKFYGGKSGGAVFTNNTPARNITYNREPSVYAGSNRVSSAMSVRLLDAAASDDSGRCTVRWEQFTGPEPVTFSDSNAAVTTVKFPVMGTYMLRLVADDGTYFRTSYVTVTITAPETVAAWEFNTDEDSEGWTGTAIGNRSVGGGYYRGAGASGDPYLCSPDNLNIPLADIRTVEICFQNGTSSSEARFYFTTTNDAAWNEAKAKPFTAVVKDVKHTVYTVDMSTVPGWTGTLKQLRFDPASASGAFSIDYIRIKSGK